MVHYDKKIKKQTIAAVILAGGNARRLGGIAKGIIEVGENVSVIERLIKELNKADIDNDNIVIASNDSGSYQQFGVKLISDIRVGIGPIGGIESGLAYFSGQSDAVMFIPCDMPNVTAKEMLALKEAFIKTEAPVVFAETADFFWHPLCAVVHNNLKEEISSAIDLGQRKVQDIWQQVKAVRVRFTDETAFFNINNSTDMDRWRKAESEKANLF